MEYYGDFGSSMSEHSWTGQQGGISRPAEFSVVRERLAKLGDHQLFDERSAPGYKHQTFDKTEQVFDTMSNHTYPQQDHLCHYHQFAHTSPYPPPYYHHTPYFSPYHPQQPHPNCFTQTLYPHSAPPPTTYPPYQELSMNSTVVTPDQGTRVSTVPTWHPQLLVQQRGSTENAPLTFHSVPTETIQTCANARASAVTNFHVHDSALAMECQKVPSVYAANNEEDCLTKSEQEPHHGTETQSICDMLADIQTKLKTMSENLSQDLKRMKSWESKQPSAEEKIAVTAPPFVAAQTTGLPPVLGSKANSIAGSQPMLAHNLQLPMTVQDVSRISETYLFVRATPKPVFDVYDDETKGCTDEFVDEFASTPEQQLSEDPQVNVLVIHERRKEWDPGVSKLKDTVLDKGAVQVQFVQQSTELSLFSLEFSISSPKRVLWDPGVKISLYKWFNILTVWTAADKQLSCTHIPDLAAWQNQSVGGAASYIWDPGTLLWYKFIWWLFTVRTNFEHNSYSTPKFNGSKAAYSSKIFQKCKAMNSQLYWHEDIKFIGIALWLITFNPP